MAVNRRDFLTALGSLSLAGTNAYADDVLHNQLQPLKVLPFRYVPPTPVDVQTARTIPDGASKITPFEVVTYLTTATDVPVHSDPARPETFREHWIHYANPLIGLMFQDIGYAQPAGSEDYTAWCAATVSWCLKGCDYKLPPVAPAAKSFAVYGKLTNKPKPGDLVVCQSIYRPANGHVGFFVSETNEKITVRSGNQSQSIAKILATECGASIQTILFAITKSSSFRARAKGGIVFSLLDIVCTAN
ncbi:Uncharacterised protein [Burkholderia pseudomallei]|nr:Uncharacterised protein [Burkholderia pseudomallei]CAJ8045530.1 Uncharacterised protein [Burkholderia pseudomallei]